MARISNTERFPFDQTISINDYVIGTDSNNNNRTKNFQVGSLGRFLSEEFTANTPDFIFNFSLINGAEVTSGIFTVGNTNLAMSDVTTIHISTTSALNKLVTAYLETWDNAAFMVVLYDNVEPNNFLIFTVSAIANLSATIRTLTVTAVESNGSLVQDRSYAFKVIGRSNVQSDFDQTDSNAPDFIRNKPSNVVDLSTRSVTELMDVTDAGSGAIITAAERIKLSGVETGAEVNVQADWNETDTNDDSFIQNKPTDLTDLSTHLVTELFDVSNSGSGAIITTAERNKLSGIASGAEVNVQADWDETNTSSDAFIRNKPDFNETTAISLLGAFTQSSWNYNQSYTYTHNSGRIPVHVSVTGIATASNNGYSVGQRIQLSPYTHRYEDVGGANQSAFQLVYIGTTQVQLLVGQSEEIASNRNTRLRFAVLPSQWSLEIRVIG